MNRYKKANDSIHAPEELKKHVISGSSRNKFSFLKWAAPVAAALVGVVVLCAVYLPGILGVEAIRGDGSNHSGGTSSGGLSNSGTNSSGGLNDSGTNSSGGLNNSGTNSSGGLNDSGSQVVSPDYPLPQGSKNQLLSFAVAQSEYPETVPYPDLEKFKTASGDYDFNAYEVAYDNWNNARRERRQDLFDYSSSINRFSRLTAQSFLSDCGNKNVVYSPVNVYMALAMLAEVTDGASRQQVIDLLLDKSGNLDLLRESASALWTANYNDDGAVSSILASSLWMNKNIHYNQSTMNSLAKYYYASSFCGDMSSDEYSKALQNWLNEQTHGLLSEQADELKFSPETILTLATTVYYRAKWRKEFLTDFTAPDVFHSASGDVTCDFMHQGGSNTYYWGENFSSVISSFEQAGSMCYILPDENVNVTELLTDEQALAFIFGNKYEYENQKHLIVNQSIPKFDISSDLDLKRNLAELGITDVFQSELSDFTPMTTDTENISVSQVKHAARVSIDEEGCTATAFTAMMMTGTGMPPKDTVDFVLDRPFLFVIYGLDNMPLFIGIVNQP